MGMIEAKIKWESGIRFKGTSQFSLPVTIDGSIEAGGTENGYKPTELLLFSMAGCTGIDVVRILNKMRQEISGVEIEVKAFHPDEYPKPFSRFEIKYIFTGRNLEKEKIEKAISLSDEKYCMVSQTLKGVARIITSYEIIEE